MKTQEFDSKMSPRIKRLYDNLIEKALGDRSEEWFTPEMFNDVIKYEDSEDSFPLWNNFENCSVIVRRAIAIDRMLEAMTDKNNNVKTHTADILPGDLLLGNMPMGSNGLGKVFPRFLTDDELRAGSITNRNATSLFGHNSMNYEELLKDGLWKKIKFCSDKLDELSPKIKKGKECVNKQNAIYKELQNNPSASEDERAESLRILRNMNGALISDKKKFDFYWAIKLACKSVINYAKRFAKLAEEEAIKYPERKEELETLAAIARKVPGAPAENFHEAVQSICFFHIALHASMNYFTRTPRPSAATLSGTRGRQEQGIGNIRVLHS